MKKSSQLEVSFYHKKLLFFIHLSNKKVTYLTLKIEDAESTDATLIEDASWWDETPAISSDASDNLVAVSEDSDGSGDSEVTIEVGKSTNKLSFDLDKEACERKGAWLHWFRCHTHRSKTYAPPCISRT